MTLEAQLLYAPLTSWWTPLPQIKIKTRRGGGQMRCTKFVCVCVCVCSQTGCVCVCVLIRGMSALASVQAHQCTCVYPCVCLHVCSLCEVPCAFTCVWKWHMLAVGGSAGKASWLAGGEPESEISGKKKRSCPPHVVRGGRWCSSSPFLKTYSCPLLTAGTFFFCISLVASPLANEWIVCQFIQLPVKHSIMISSLI